jgi:hypothetical protein
MGRGHVDASNAVFYQVLTINHLQVPAVVSGAVLGPPLIGVAVWRLAGVCGKGEVEYWVAEGLRKFDTYN